MQINVLGDDSVIKLSLEEIGYTPKDLKACRIFSISPMKYRIVDSYNPSKIMVFDKIDINELLTGVEVDVSNVLCCGCECDDISHLEHKDKVDCCSEPMPIVSDDDFKPTNIWEEWFERFLKMAGITNLKHYQVNLGYADLKMEIGVSETHQCLRGITYIKVCDVAPEHFKPIEPQEVDK